MSTANKPRITLEFEAGADPIRGSIEHADGSRQPFWGWLELSEKLRRVASDAPERPFHPTQANPAQTPETDPLAKRLPRTTTREER